MRAGKITMAVISLLTVLYRAIHSLLKNINIVRIQPLKLSHSHRNCHRIVDEICIITNQF